METNLTFAMVKPGAMSRNLLGNIISVILDNGFLIKGMKLVKMTPELASDFYSVHRGLPFFEPLVQFMTSGPIVALVLEKENAVPEFRKLIGSTDPEKAEPGTIRSMYARNTRENAVHGSDSVENVYREMAFFFKPDELV
jgi:nucleoside-diphosphate kinase